MIDKDLVKGLEIRPDVISDTEGIMIHLNDNSITVRDTNNFCIDRKFKDRETINELVSSIMKLMYQKEDTK